MSKGGDCGSGDDGEEGDGEDDNELLDKKKNGEMITRLKGMLRVISCTRTATLDGYSSIQAVVQLDNDGKMDKGVKESVRLHFTFLREPQHERDVDDKDDNTKPDGKKEANTETMHEQQLTKKRKLGSEDAAASIDGEDETDDEISGNGSDNLKNGQVNSTKMCVPKTIVTYKIDYSVDYGPMEQLLGVDIYALGEHPSVEEAVPMINNDMDEEDKDNCAAINTFGDDNKHNLHDNSPTKSRIENEKQSSSDDDFEEIVMSDDGGSSTSNKESQSDESKGGGDEFGVFINPENVVAFVDRMNMNLNEQSLFYLLLTFPFYEHEWDISGFLLSALFDEDEDVQEDEDVLEE